MMQLTDVRLWNVDEYHKMLDAAILTDRDRVELLDGQVLLMSPQRPPHAATTQSASDYLRTLLENKATLRTQLPITLTPNSEPEPDIAAVRIDSRNYFEQHPSAADIFLLVEVADTTLKRDCSLKASVYARSGILDYWVLDVTTQRVYLFREPHGDRYRQERLLDKQAKLFLLAFPEIEVEIGCLFPE